MRWLILGGYRFLGRHLVDAALARGDEVWLFNRGRSAAPPPQVHRLVGDRSHDLQALQAAGLSAFDAVIDTCGYRPAELRASAQALRGRAARYAFISSVSVYADSRQPNAEHAPLAALPPGSDEHTLTNDRYGALKAACEQALVAIWGAPGSLCIRPGLIVGPHDPTGRFSWWPARLARARPGEPVLAPGPAGQPVQCIDARDLAQFTLDALVQGAHGPVNVTSPPGALDMAGLLAAVAAAAGVQPAWQWVPADWLLAQGVQPWMDLPLWLPAQGEHAAFMQVPVDRALALGLRTRPLQVTAADTLAWWQALPPEAQAFAQTGLAAEREAHLLRAFAGLPAV